MLDDEPRRETDRWWPWLPWVAAAVAMAIALPTLGSRDLWLDESFTVGAANQVPESIIRRSGSMAIYYLLMVPWTEISIDAAFLRLPSVAFAAAAVGVSVHLAARLFGPRVALLTAVLLVPMWGVLRYAQEARSYSLMMLLSMISWLFIARIREEPRASLWVAWGIASAALVYAHPYGAFLLVAQAALLRSEADSMQELFHQTRVGLLTLGAALVPMGLMLFQPDDTFPGWIPELGMWTFETSFEMIAGRVGWAQIVAAGAVLAATIVVGTTGWRNWGERALLLWVWLPPTVLVVISLAQPAVVGRYLIGSLPAVAMLLAVAIERVPRRDLQLAIVALLVASMLPGHMKQQRDPGAPWSDAVAIVEAGSSDGRAHGVLFLDFYHRPAFEVNAGTSAVFAQTTPILPSEPWGEALRYYDEVSTADLMSQLTQIDVLWTIEQDVVSWAGLEPEGRSSEQVVYSLGFCAESFEELPHAISVARYVRCGN